MALESFYGGKPGFSPVIKARFKYINSEDPAYKARYNTETQESHKTKLTKEEAAWLNNFFNVSSYIEDDEIEWDSTNLKPFTMDECFSNPNYTDVWYGELCIIDTDNKMNPNNGKLYRRTLKKADDDRWTSAGNTLYAEYIGQIVGPAGGIPNLDLGSLDTERRKAVGLEQTIATDSVPLNISNWEYAYPGLNGKISNTIPSNYNDIQILNAGGINGSNIEIIPGKQEIENEEGITTIVYNDTIKYTWCNVRRTLDDSNSDAWFYLGFQIPYTFFDVNTIEENYTYSGDIFINSSDPNHPFYKNYEFHIPRGARGIGPEEIFIVNPQDSLSPTAPESLYKFDAIQYDQENDTYSINEAKKLDPKPTGSYWVGLWKLYNPKTTTITSVYQYLGSYKDIREVNLATDGTLTFTYSDGNSTSFEKKIKWINSINIDTANKKTNPTYGQITINYNNGNPSSYSQTLPLVKNFSVDNNTGKINIQYADNTNEDIGTINNIKQTWIDSGGHLLILYTSSDYRPADSERGFLNDRRYQQLLANPNGNYSQPQTWVKGDGNNTIAGTDSTWWHDLGEVYKISTPQITTSYDGQNKTVDEIIPNLNGLYVNGYIGETKGGLIAVENIKIDEHTLETRIFYYDEVKRTWADLGAFGSSGGSGSSSSDGSTFYVEGYNISYNGTDIGASVSDENKHITYPSGSAINPEFYFTSSQKINQINDSTVYAPSGTVDSYAALGNGIHLFDYIPT